MQQWLSFLISKMPPVIHIFAIMLIPRIRWHKKAGQANERKDHVPCKNSQQSSLKDVEF